jgi:hypothetical protein
MPFPRNDIIQAQIGFGTNRKICDKKTTAAKKSLIFSLIKHLEPLANI